MQIFEPAANERKSEELIEIVSSGSDNWHPDLIKIAELELIKRGVSLNEQTENKRSFQCNLLNEEKEFQKWLESNRVESYNKLEILKIILFTPKIFRFESAYDLSI